MTMHQQQERSDDEVCSARSAEAKRDKEKEVADFLRSPFPLVNAEPGTITWFAIQEGPSSFDIFDCFDDEPGERRT
jgi:hypothetical protein